MIEDQEKYYTIRMIKYSEWQCHLFASGRNGISWRPLEGQEPNWFWRWMQWICFGNRWVRDDPR
jgi:hypothetical protein